MCEPCRHEAVLACIVSCKQHLQEVVYVKAMLSSAVAKMHKLTVREGPDQVLEQRGL